MATVVQVVVVAGGSCWDLIVLTHSTLLTRRHNTSTIKLIGYPQKGLTEEFAVSCSKHITNDQDKEHVDSEFQDHEKSETDFSLEHVDKEQICQLCLKLHLLNVSCIDMEDVGSGSKCQVIGKPLINTYPLQYKTEGLHFAVFLRELQTSSVYRQLVLQNWKHQHPKDSQNGTRQRLTIRWKLKDTIPYIIDDRWCLRVNRCAQERQHIDTSMSWLSTLGGACSALGDYSARFAMRAGTISIQQMEIAVRLGDPGAVSRCRLYAAISFIQQYKFKLARNIILQEYRWLHSLPPSLRDIRLTNMCQGIWTKLIYEKNCYHNHKSQGKSSIVASSK